MDTQVNEKWSLGDSGRSVHNKTPAVRPKNWQRNNRYIFIKVSCLVLSDL